MREENDTSTPRFSVLGYTQIPGFPVVTLLATRTPFHIHFLPTDKYGLKIFWKELSFFFLFYLMTAASWLIRGMRHYMRRSEIKLIYFSTFFSRKYARL